MTTYRMMQLPPNVTNMPKGFFSAVPPAGQGAAAYLEKVVKEHSKQGWEFHRVDSIGVIMRGGCLGLGK